MRTILAFLLALLSLLPAACRSGHEAADADRAAALTAPATPAPPPSSTPAPAPAPGPASVAASCDGPSATCTRFRAVGNEPGWMAELTFGKAPRLHAELDYGDRIYDIAGLTTGKDGWSGTAADGTTLALSYRPGGCQDGMSGRAFPVSVTLHAGERTYTGCGAFLP